LIHGLGLLDEGTNHFGLLQGLLQPLQFFFFGPLAPLKRPSVEERKGGGRQRGREKKEDSEREGGERGAYVTRRLGGNIAGGKGDGKDVQLIVQ
jgi:hypothetical protein